MLRKTFHLNPWTSIFSSTLFALQSFNVAMLPFAITILSTWSRILEQCMNLRTSSRPNRIKMRRRMDTLKSMLLWFIFLLAGMLTDLQILADLSPVKFPSDEALKIHLPEWVPKERGVRAAQNRHRQRYRDRDDSQEYAIKIKGERRAQSGGINCVLIQLVTFQIRSLERTCSDVQRITRWSRVSAKKKVTVFISRSKMSLFDKAQWTFFKNLSTHDIIFCTKSSLDSKTR